MENSFYSIDELLNLGIAKIGKNVLISRKTSIYSPENINIGDNVRIDDFCILSGTICIGNYIHIAAYSSLFAGNAGIIIEDYSNISSRVSIYALSDDFSGDSMTNPMIPDIFKSVYQEKVIIRKNVIIGTGSTVLPGVILNEGTAVGAMSLIKTSTEPWGIYAGIPANYKKQRSNRLLERLIEFEGNEKNGNNE